MVDEEPSTQPETTDEQTSAPAVLGTQNVSQFAIAITPAEFLISLGHACIPVPHAGPVGADVTPEPYVEWLLTLSISPIAAVTLSERLRASIADYEKQFGKIPIDPNLRVRAARG
jgi:hypothetical protein